MPIEYGEASFALLSAKELGAWREIPPAVASDCMNRTQVMKAAIKPVTGSTTLCGQARTVTTMPPDTIIDTRRGASCARAVAASSALKSAASRRATTFIAPFYSLDSPDSPTLRLSRLS